LLERKKLLQVIALIATAGVIFFALRAWGIAGDCRPNQVDGQCGMSSAFGELFGMVAAAVILVAGFIGLFITWGKSRK
jgi:hypothetical protein